MKNKVSLEILEYLAEHLDEEFDIYDFRNHLIEDLNYEWPKFEDHGNSVNEPHNIRIYQNLTQALSHFLTSSSINILLQPERHQSNPNTINASFHLKEGVIFDVLEYIELKLARTEATKANIRAETAQQSSTCALVISIIALIASIIFSFLQIQLSHEQIKQSQEPITIKNTNKPLKVTTQLNLNSLEMKLDQILRKENLVK